MALRAMGDSPYTARAAALARNDRLSREQAPGADRAQQQGQQDQQPAGRAHRSEQQRAQEAQARHHARRHRGLAQARGPPPRPPLRQELAHRRPRRGELADRRQGPEHQGADPRHHQHHRGRRRGPWPATTRCRTARSCASGRGPPSWPPTTRFSPSALRVRAWIRGGALAHQRQVVDVADPAVGLHLPAGAGNLGQVEDAPPPGGEDVDAAAPRPTSNAPMNSTIESTRCRRHHPHEPAGAVVGERRDRVWWRSSRRSRTSTAGARRTGPDGGRRRGG